MTVGIHDVGAELKFFLNFADDAVDTAMGDVLARRFSIILHAICCDTEGNVIARMRHED